MISLSYNHMTIICTKVTVYEHLTSPFSQSLQKKLEERKEQKKEPGFLKHLLSDVLEDVGPSMLMSSTCQTVSTE